MEAKNIHSNKSNHNGWNHNTALGCDLKTILRCDRIMKPGKEYTGVLKRDVESEDFRYDEHYTFTEALPWTMKRNPKLFSGRYISVTIQDDGTPRPNFKPLKVDEDFSVDGYALAVCNELRQALTGLVEK